MTNSNIEKCKNLDFETGKYLSILFSIKWRLLKDWTHMLHSFKLRISVSSWKWESNIYLVSKTEELQCNKYTVIWHDWNVHSKRSKTLAHYLTQGTYNKSWSNPLSSGLKWQIIKLGSIMKHHNLQSLAILRFILRNTVFDIFASTQKSSFKEKEQVENCRLIKSLMFQPSF